MKQNIRYIVVHSTQTLPTELYQSLTYHYFIHRNGKVVTGKKLTAGDGCVQVAYVGGIDKQRKVCDTTTSEQSEALFNMLITLSEKYPEAKIVSADEIFGKENFPGFNVRQWLKNFIPATLTRA